MHFVADRAWRSHAARQVVAVNAVAKARPAESEDGEEADPVEAAEEEGAKKNVWKPTDYKWSVTNGRAQNLPELFRMYMGLRAQFEEKKWTSYNATSHGDAAVKALEDFCKNVSDETSNMTKYTQVIFNDLE